MDSYVSPPIKLTGAQAARAFARADLVFYDVDAGRASFAANVFMDPADTTPDLAPSRTAGYAGFFFILGHGGRFGDVGHCDVPQTRDPTARSARGPLLIDALTFSSFRLLTYD